MKSKNLYQRASDEIKQQLDYEIFLMYSGISEKSARQFENFCRHNDWLLPSGIKISMMSGEAEAHFGDAIKLTQFNWSEKTKAHRLKQFPSNERFGVEFKDHGFLLIRSLKSKEEALANQRTIELVFKAFLSGAGARAEGLKKKALW